ncbi:MAG: DUF6491 family protein [Myxococcota bacterium]
MTRWLRLAMVALVWGCASAEAPEAERSRRLPEMTLECVFLEAVNNWREIDRYNLIIWASPQRAYLLELEVPCERLGFVETVGFQTHDPARVCAFAGDAVLVEDERCPIGAIRPYKLDEAFDGGKIRKEPE